MKTFVKVSLFVVVAMWAGNSYAQEKLSDEKREEMLAKWESYKAELNLSEEQSEKMKTVNTTYFEGLASLKQSGGTKLSKWKTYKKLSDNRDKQMKEILDSEQYDRYKKMQKEVREELKNKRKS